MKDIDERYIIKILTDTLNLEHDDVSFIKLDNKFLVLKCDMLVRSTDAPKEMLLWQIARKSIVAALSDMVCKGIKPIAALISLAIPKNFTSDDIKELVKGFSIAKDEFGLNIIGGDTNEGCDLIIDCIMAGISNNIIRRSTAKIGDLIISTGLFGYPSSGLKILLNNAKAEERFKEKAINSVFIPKPKTEFLNIKDYVNSSMDSSDGLSITLNELANASKKMFIIDNIPSSSDIYEFAKNNNYDPEELIFSGGEEYEIIATIDKEYLDLIKKVMPIYVIGEVKEGNGVYIKEGSRLRRLEGKGFIHLTKDK
jgi:thiamine-monophosphate kinase